MTTSASRILSARNLNILLDVARFKLMTTDHIRHLHFYHLTRCSEAPRMLMYRFHKVGLVDKHQTYARSTQTSDGLAVTKPKPVWYMSKKCVSTLKRQLDQQGRSNEYAPFEDVDSRISNRLSFSDQSLPHELGITSILLALERGAAEVSHIEDLIWVRTSPRHPLTSTKVSYSNQNHTVTRTINPDAIAFFRATNADKRYPFFFFIEYETGTANAQKYFTHKLEPYNAYLDQSKCQRGERPFSGTASQFNRDWNLGVNHPEHIPFRVLTVTSDTAHANKLVSVSLGLNNKKLCLFTSLKEFISGPFDNIWSRALELDAAVIDKCSKKTHDERGVNRSTNSTRQALADNLTRVSIP